VDGFFSAAAFFDRIATPGFAGPDIAGLSADALAGVAAAGFAAFFARGSRVPVVAAGVLSAALIGLVMCGLE
jgi:hypothetical protein